MRLAASSRRCGLRGVVIRSKALLAMAVACAVLAGSIAVSESVVAAAPSSPWLMYGHDSSHSGLAAPNGPSTSAAPAWTFNLNTAARDNASPVVGPDGSVYVPSETGFFAFNSNGTLRCKQWGTDAFDWTTTRMAPAVAGDGSAVYVTKWPGDALFALNPVDCSVLWSYPIGHTSYGSPTLGADGTIYIGGTPSGSTSRFYAINPNGTLKWQWDSGSGCWIESSAALGPSGDVYFGHNCLGLVKLSSVGALIWNRTDLGAAFNSPSVAGDGTIYIAASAAMKAVNPNGTDKWTALTDNWMYDGAAAIGPDGTVYRGDNAGQFYAFTSTGSEKWQYNSGTGQITSMPALSGNGMVYFTSSVGEVTALNTTTGSLVWKRSIGSTTSSPALGTNGTLYVLGSDTTGKGVIQAYSPPADTSAPTGIVTAPAANALVTRPVSITGSASDNVGVASVKLSIRNLQNQSWNGSAWVVGPAQVTAALSTPGGTSTSWSYSFNPPESADIYSLIATVADAGGNNTALATRTFTTDAVAPAGTITAPAANSTNPKPVVISGTATDNVSVVSVRLVIKNTAGKFWNGSAWVTASTTVEAVMASPGAPSTTWSYSFNPPGSGQNYTAKVTVYDIKKSTSLPVRSFFTS
jgi:outer membrane protein assembly factor BamB